jgi:phospholipid transport system transporter-binding protein
MHPGAELRQTTPHRWVAGGSLSFTTARGLYDGFARGYVAGSQSVLDLSAITHCDSAGLAFLIECRRIAGASGGTISFVGAPAQLLALARAHQVLALIDPAAR